MRIPFIKNQNEKKGTVIAYDFIYPLLYLLLVEPKVQHQ